MNMQNITVQMICEMFSLTPANDGIYLLDAKGRGRLITDMRREYAKNKTAAVKKTKVSVSQKESRLNHINEALELLKLNFPELDVLIRETQPGIRCPELGFNVYCIIGHTDSHVVNMDSTVFSREDLNSFFAEYSLYKNQETGVTISIKNGFDELVQAVQTMIMYHNKAA